MENFKQAGFSIEQYYFDQVHINLDCQSGAFSDCLLFRISK